MKQIALTFDDGPNVHTNQILDILAKNNIKATFFIWAKFEAQHQEIMTRMVKLGHELGNHTYSHLDLTHASEEVINDEVLKTDEIIVRYTHKIPHLFRPPYGSINDEIRRYIDKNIILWTVDSKDWSDIEVKDIIDNVLNQVTDNDIVLLHCFEQTVFALPAIIEKLVEKNYQFVTVDEVLARKKKVN